jgi:hypothetical protein
MQERKTASPTMWLAVFSHVDLLEGSLPFFAASASAPPDMKEISREAMMPKTGSTAPQTSASFHEQSQKMMTMDDPTPPRICAIRSSCSVVSVCTFSTFSLRKVVRFGAEFSSTSKKPIS